MLTELEPRLLLAGDAGAAVAEVATPTADTAQAAPASSRAAASPTDLVIVDAGVDDLATLVDAIPAGAEIVMIDADQNGIEQITGILASHQNLRSVHLLCHGSEGMLALGNQSITEDDLVHHQASIATWRQSMTQGGDLLIYGCDVAGNADGVRFVNRLASIAGVDVAASNDRTGNATAIQDADWNLEYQVGQIESANLLAASHLRNFNGHLAIDIFAAGSTGDEQIQVLLSGQVVDTFTLQGTDADAGQFSRYTVNRDNVNPGDIRINFINDVYDPANGVDRNLRLDRIVVDGVTLQAEDPSVFVDGGFITGQGIGSGNLETEYIFTNGFFQFASTGNPGGANGSNIEVSLAGDTGTESAQLLIDGSVVATYNNISTAGQVFSFEADGTVTADRVRVAFINDVFDPGVFDRNLDVDFIRIDGQVFQTEAVTTFSTGTWLPEDGIAPGFRQSETLHTNGYFQFLAVNDPGSGGNAGSFSLVTSEITVTEGQGAVTLIVQRVGGSDGNASIDFFTAGDSAIEGQDFQSNSGRLFFADGETVKQFTVNIINDDVAESTEDFTVRIDNAIGADLLAPRTSIITVRDDDSNLPRFASFDSSAELNLNGSASVTGGALQLTGAVNQQAGSAFYNSPITISNNTSFQSSFSFQIGGGSGAGGADGFAFLLQNSAAGSDAIGRNGGFLGYDTIGRSLAIEFDTGQNGWDIASDTISVVVNGQVTNELIETVSPFNLNNDTQYHAWVDYNGDTNTLAVFISQTADKPIFAVLKTTIDLQPIVGDQAYVGFSAATFNRPNFHRIGSWDFTLDTPFGDPPLNPSGDVVEQDLVTGLNQPLALAWSADGRNVYIAEKAGVIKVVRDGSTSAITVLDITANVNNLQDRGLIDIELDPNFLSNGYLYATYTYDPAEVYENIGNAFAGPDGRGNRAARVSRFTLDSSTGFTTFVSGSEVVLVGKNSTWDNYNGFTDSTDNFGEPQGGQVNGVFIDDFINSDSRSHTVGALAFAADGSLFVSIGDGASFSRTDSRALRVQDVNSLSGKVLRIDPATGQGLSDNPFFNGDPNSNASKVYQLGLRNPWRLSVDPSSDRLFIGDTGLGSYEEINTGGAGANFGWPFYEGAQGVNSRTPGYRDLPQAGAFYGTVSATPAEIALQHQGGSDAVVLGDIVTNLDLGIQYEGDLFYNDLYRGVIRHADVAADGSLSNVQVFTTGAAFVTDIQQSPGGSLYYVNLIEGTFGRWQIV